MSAYDTHTSADLGKAISKYKATLKVAKKSKAQKLTMIKDINSGNHIKGITKGVRKKRKYKRPASVQSKMDNKAKARQFKKDINAGLKKRRANIRAAAKAKKALQADIKRAAHARKKAKAAEKRAQKELKRDKARDKKMKKMGLPSSFSSTG